MKKLSIVAILMFLPFASFAQEVSNTICMGDTCLNGVSATVLIGATTAVTLATILLKFVKKDSFVGKILDKIANLKVK